MGEIEVNATTPQEEVTEIRVRLPADERGTIAIETVAPEALAGRLRAQGILTLRDLLGRPAVVDAADPEGLERVRGAARFAVLASELSEPERERLLDEGFRGPVDLAASPRAAFVEDHHEQLGGDAATYVTHFAAREARKVLHHMIGGAWFEVVGPPGDDEIDPDIPPGVVDTLNDQKTCGCSDCQAAVGPAAYLASLLEWTLEHTRSQNDSITLAQLEGEFHQPFATLPASCEAVEQPVRLARLCVEALWRFTGLRDSTDLQLAFSFRNSYRHVRDRLYEQILINLGVGFEQLRKATLQIPGDSPFADVVATHRRTVADVLGIDESHVGDLFFNIDLSPGSPTSPTEVALQALFGFRSTRLENVFDALETPELIAWQRERLEAIWRTQDWSIDLYSGDGRLPFIDPAIIDASYLRTTLDGNPAAPVLEARQQEVAAHRQTLVDANPQANGLAGFLANELGSSIEELRALFASLQSSDSPEQVVQAEEAIAALHLTPAGLTRLMDIDARLQEGEPIGATEEEIEAAWASVFDVLSRRHRHSLFSTWVDEEQEQEIVLGPRHFWLPLRPATPLNPWQATAAERSAWEEALRRRSRAPIVDPDQIAKSYVIAILSFSPSFVSPMLAFQAPFMPPLTAFQLWEDRRAWIDARIELLRQSRQGQATPLGSFGAMLEASTLGIGLEVFTELADLEIAGEDLKPRLAQLGFSLQAHRALADVHLLAVAGASVSVDQWQAVEAILVQAEKQREFADWREAEQGAEIILHPWRFVLPDPPPAIDDSPHTRWLHDLAALRQWTATLDARQAQFRALDQALATAVGDAEEMVLPLLRNILIMESVASGSTLTAKADWLDRRLLIDMRTDGCHMTTRVSQAIETLQRFVRGIYTDEHLDLMQHLTLDSDQDYEAEWPVLGAYATWRAFMLAYLYPENLLHLVPPLSRSFGFSRLRGKLPTRISPADACAAADSYADYFRDVCHLQVQASCQVKTIAAGKGGCGAVVSVLRSRVHLFAVATTSSSIYTASFEGYKDAEDTLDSWQPVPGFENVLEIIGAVPHETPTHQRLILLFAKVRERSANRLMVASFDLDTLSWGKPRELDLPPGTGSDFTAVAVQKRHGSPGETAVFTPGVSAGASDVPTILAIRAPGGRVYIRYVSSSASHWAGDDWIPLFGPLIAERTAEVCALIQTGAQNYLLILRSDDGWLKYRSFSTEPAVSRDDGFWRSIAMGAFAGAVLWPGTPEVFVFYEAAGATRYAIVGPPVDLLPAGSPRQSITELDGWLTSVVGVSLDSFHVDISRTWTFNPRLDTDDDHRPLSAIEVEIPFEGSIKKLLQMSVSQWDGKDSLPSGHDYVVFTDDAYLEALQAEGLREFRDRLSAISEFQGSLGDWKLADWYTRQFADGKGLASAVEDAFNSDATTFRFRGFISETTLVGTASSDSWYLVPSGGDQEPGPPTRKAVALRTSDGTFRMKIRRTGNTLSAPALRRVTPDGDGPFELGPLAAKEDLQLRRVQVKDFYQSVAGAPPSVMVYLKEAFNLVPLHLGFELQRNGFYDEALLWYRQVYDYLQTAGKQKIDHSLKAEESLALGYDEAEAWLGDASNAHAIAATRKNTYTRHALLTIIRCLIDFGDRLFSRDNVTDNARARDLYKSALLLLGSKVLKPGSSSCAEIIGELEIELASGQLPVSQFQAVLAEIQDPDSLREAITSLNAIIGDPNGGTVERLTSMREVVGSVVAEARPPRTMGGVLDAKRLTYQSLENHYLGDLRSRALLQSVHQGRRQARLQAVADVARVPEETLLREGTPLPWLRAARSSGGDDAADERLVEFAVPRLTGSPRMAVFDRIRAAEPLRTLSMSAVGGIALNPGISFDFCIPQNPVVSALRRRAENNLRKLRTCRNIAGMERELDPYGAPIGLGSGLVSPDGKIFSGIVDAPPTPYRYAALVARAKELVNVAQQIESSYLTALESAEREALSALQAEQSVEQAAARVTLQDLRLNQAHSELGLAQLQRGSAVLRESTYADWIAGGKNDHEQTLLSAYHDAGEAQQAANAARTVGQVAGFAAAAVESTTHAQGPFAKIVSGASAGLRSVQAAAAAAEGVATGFAINAQTRAQVASLEASFERRKDEWQLQQGLAALDARIGEQQIQLARDAIAIGQQERAIAGLEHAHAADVLEFLKSRTFTEEMYRWIASVLENVYRFFLQEATSIAHSAELTLAFERQQSPLNVIQSDYWNVAADESGTIVAGARVDRLGLTGSARLLKDLYQLDQVLVRDQTAQARGDGHVGPREAVSRRVPAVPGGGHLHLRHFIEPDRPSAARRVPVSHSTGGRFGGRARSSDRPDKSVGDVGWNIESGGGRGHLPDRDDPEPAGARRVDGSDNSCGHHRTRAGRAVAVASVRRLWRRHALDAADAASRKCLRLQHHRDRAVHD